MTNSPIESLTVRQLKGFVTVAEELHFGRAAERLEISQPSLSQLVARVEEVLEMELFSRRPSVCLTEAGALLLPQVREALLSIKRGVNEAQDLASGTSGHLRIRFAASVLSAPFPEILLRFQRQFPMVKINLRKDSSASIRTNLENDEIGVARYPLGTKLPHAISLVEEPFVVALPRGHPLLNAPQINLGALRDEPFIHFPRHESPALHEEIAHACRARGFKPRIVLEATEWLTIIGLVRSGLGLAFVPASFQSLLWEGAEYRHLSSGAPNSVVVAWHRSQAISPVVKHFMKATKETGLH